jgi:hypothetical protein
MAEVWNIDSLKALMDVKFEAQQKAVESAFRSSEKAIEKSEAAQTAYNARSNEFRSSLDDQNKTFLPRTEADARFNQMRDLIDAQKELIGVLQNAASRDEGGVTAAGAAKTNSQWIIYIMVIIGLEALNGAAFLIFYLSTKK